MNPLKWSIAVLAACIIGFGVMLFSPVMGPDTFGGESSCGSVRSLFVSGGETHNNGGEISAQQFEDRITNCRAAFERQAPTLLIPLALGLIAAVTVTVLAVSKRRAVVQT
jgi:hypothetical protein